MFFNFFNKQKETVKYAEPYNTFFELNNNNNSYINQEQYDYFKTLGIEEQLVLLNEYLNMSYEEKDKLYSISKYYKASHDPRRRYYENIKKILKIIQNPHNENTIESLLNKVSSEEQDKLLLLCSDWNNDMFGITSLEVLNEIFNEIINREITDDDRQIKMIVYDICNKNFVTDLSDSDRDWIPKYIFDVVKRYNIQKTDRPIKLVDYIESKMEEYNDIEELPHYNFLFGFGRKQSLTRTVSSTKKIKKVFK